MAQNEHIASGSGNAKIIYCSGRVDCLPDSDYSFEKVMGEKGNDSHSDSGSCRTDCITAMGRNAWIPSVDTWNSSEYFLYADCDLYLL